jgi:hypothetical protein
MVVSPVSDVTEAVSDGTDKMLSRTPNIPPANEMRFRPLNGVGWIR